jgi:hypothetical protein
MPDDKSKSGSPAKPSFYSAAAGMKPGGAGAGEPPAGSSTTGAGQQGEKVKQIEVLLEVFAKLDKQEQDPDGKAMIQAMVDQAKKYLDKIKGTESKGPGAAPPVGEAGSGGPGAGPEAGGAGAGPAGPGVGAPGGMAA